MRSRMINLMLQAIAIVSLVGSPLAAQTVPAPPASAVATDVSINVAPAAAAVQAGKSLQFMATVSGTTAASLAWKATGGTVSPNGLFAAGTTPGTYGVSASLADGTGAATIHVVVSSAAPVSVVPGQDLAAAVANAPAGTAFVLKAGVHRLTTSVVPRDGNAFVGEPGAVLSGARLLTNWTQSGAYWVVTGQTQQGPLGGQCLASSPMCQYPEDLYVDDKLVKHVGSMSQLVAGTWYFDYNADAIYVADNPSGHRVETTVIRQAFTGSASAVSISALTVEKFANPAQAGAIHGNSTTNWIVQDNEVRWNHGVGIRVGNGMRVLKNQVHHNGQMGIGGIGNNVLVEDNGIAFNNTVGYDPGWEAGGTKFVQTQGLIVRGNHSHDNNGPGLWTDIDNQNTLYENNIVENNHGAGIFHEISYSAVIRNNIVRGNGSTSAGWLWDAGIQIAASPNVEVYGNRVEKNANGIAALQQNRGTGAYGPHLVQNLYVHDNIVTMQTGGSGLVQDIGDNSCFTSYNNRFVHDTYYLGTNTNYFAWMNGWWSESGWKAQGEDVTGVFIR